MNIVRLKCFVQPLNPETHVNFVKPRRHVGLVKTVEWLKALQSVNSQGSEKYLMSQSIVSASLISIEEARSFLHS